MSDSIGLGYLGLDDPEHERQARAVNAALEAIGEAESFAYGHAAAAGVLAQLRQMADAAVQLGLPHEAPVDLERLSETVLAVLCRQWFGVPDGLHLAGVGPAPDETPRCPHALFSVSRYVFGVHPSERVCTAGRHDGQAFREGIWRWLQATPRAALPELAQAILAGVPGQDAELLARTFAGILLGFPPTTHANLLWCLGAWVGKGKFWELQQAWLDVPPAERGFAAAVRELRPALMATLNLRPTPFQILRQIRVPHRLGPIELQADDLLVVGLGSATQQNPGLHHLPFGGDRADPDGPPPHACPGYAMGMGVMLGVVAALLETSTLKATGNPLGLYLQ
jgi:cytochrome P450